MYCIPNQSVLLLFSFLKGFVLLSQFNNVSCELMDFVDKYYNAQPLLYTS